MSERVLCDVDAQFMKDILPSFYIYQKANDFSESIEHRKTERGKKRTEMIISILSVELLFADSCVNLTDTHISHTNINVRTQICDI